MKLEALARGNVRMCVQYRSVFCVRFALRKYKGRDGGPAVGVWMCMVQ